MKVKMDRELRPVSALVELTKEDDGKEGPAYFSHEAIMDKTQGMFGQGPFNNKSSQLIGYFEGFVGEGYVERVIFVRGGTGKRSHIYRANLEKTAELESEFPERIDIQSTD